LKRTGTRISPIRVILDLVMSSTTVVCVIRAPVNKKILSKRENKNATITHPVTIHNSSLAISLEFISLKFYVGVAVIGCNDTDLAALKFKYVTKPFKKVMN